LPEALTSDQIDRAEAVTIEAIHADPKLTTKAAVEKAGINRATFYRLMAHRKGFGERIRAAQAPARQAACDDLEEHLYDRAADPKNPTGVTAAIFLLKGNRPGLYGERRDPRKVAMEVLGHRTRKTFERYHIVSGKRQAGRREN
jgi:hypothetical protein